MPRLQIAYKPSLCVVVKGLNAREAGYKVGYSNPFQFSREFKRMFGSAPGQLVKSLLD